MYLFDTDILTLAHMGHPRIRSRSLQVGEMSIGTTVITAIEVLRDRHAYLLKASDGPQLLRAQQLLGESETLLGRIKVRLIDALAAAEFDRLRQNTKLKKIGRGDLLIACIALANRATLVTRNLRHFQLIPGLPLENWAD